MTDQTMYEKLKAPCPCGAKREDGTPFSYVEHCGREEMCPCGSGKKAIECCFVDPKSHGM